ncbi:MAG: rhodanese-like domain-containing protein [Desulfuromonadales bacterium]|nr:rhodanese-like domain-containing protein [Desulfuromonadales bacterium]
MKLKLSLNILLAVSLLVLSGCATSINSADLLEKMQQQPGPLVIDVRSQGEFDRDHLPGAVHIPFYSISSELGKREDVKRRSVVVYCEHGPRAAFAGFMLHLSGYEQINTLEGQMRGWRSAGFPVEKTVP